VTNREKIQLAAERIIEFGLDGTLWSADRLRHEATCAPIRITWEPAERCRVRLHVDEHKGAVRVRIEAKMGKVDHAEARKHGTFMNRIAFFAQQIEEAIGQGEAS
jgi:hypothetical protein